MAKPKKDVEEAAETITEFGAPGRAARASAVRGLAYIPELPPRLNCKPAVFVVRSTWRTADAPSSPTQRYRPSEVMASLFGSLPTKIGVPSAPVTGSTDTTELP